MSIQHFKTLKNLVGSELAVKIRETEAQLFEARMKKKTNQLKDTAMIWRMRKDLARLKMLQKTS